MKQLYCLSRSPGGVALVVSEYTDAELLLEKRRIDRGIRNNNPGNIDWIEVPEKRWSGMFRKETAAEGGRFGVFDTPANGVRAIGKELFLDIRRGVVTIQGLISNWAPGNENNTAAYIQHAVKMVGIPADRDIRMRPQPADKAPSYIGDVVIRIADAIVTHECGANPYPPNRFAEWVVAN